MTVSRTFKFPGGSIVLYSHPEGLGEIVLFSKRKVFFKVFYNLEELENTFDELIEEIEKEFIESARSVLGRKYILKDLLKL